MHEATEWFAGEGAPERAEAGFVGKAVLGEHVEHPQVPRARHATASDAIAAHLNACGLL
jgi:hypothetical protein